MDLGGKVEKDGNYKESLIKLAQKLGVENRLIFAGVVRGIDKYYLIKKAKMMVHMAIWESYCNVVHEGLSQGLICIVANNTALPLLVENGVNGFTIKTRDYKSLAQKINYVYENYNSKELKDMRSKNKQIGENESWKTVAEKMENYYKTGNPKSKSHKALFLFTIIFLALIYLLTIRGNWNIPTPEEIDIKLANPGQAFETSQEGSRYAMILAILNDKTIAIDNYASMGTPDIGFINGHFYSFFPPGTSILAIPLYLIGLKLGATQIFTFLISTIFAALTILLTIKISLKLNIHWTKALFAGIAFGFATNAWGYSITLYAHLVSAFLVLSGVYLSVIKKSHTVFDCILFWLIYTFAVYIDFPNLFIYLPLALIFTFNFFEIEKSDKKTSVSIRLRYLLTPLIFIVAMGLYGLYNQHFFGSPGTLSNSIPRITDIKKQAESERSSAGALDTRDFLEGFLSFTVRTDRGVLIYSPIAFLSLFILFGAYKKLHPTEKLGLFAVPATCLTIYSMFGDPYGGWAFGSRYMIAIMPELCILAAYALNNLDKKVIVKLIYSIVFLYSMGVSLMAPLTTNVISPIVEGKWLGLTSDYRVNIQMLNQGVLNSFVYNNFAKTYVNGWQYYGIIYTLVASAGLFTIWKGKKDET